MAAMSRARDLTSFELQDHPGPQAGTVQSIYPTHPHFNLTSTHHYGKQNIQATSRKHPRFPSITDPWLGKAPSIVGLAPWMRRSMDRCWIAAWTITGCIVDAGLDSLQQYDNTVYRTPASSQA